MRSTRSARSATTSAERPRETPSARPDHPLRRHLGRSSATSRRLSRACATSPLHAYVFIVGGLLMLGVVAAAGDAIPRRLRSELRRRARPSRPGRSKQLPEIEKLEREVTLATASAYDLHFRLLPHLREIAAGPPRARRPLARAGHPRPLVGAAPRRPAGTGGPVRQGHHPGRTACPDQRPCEDVTRDDRSRRSRPALEPRPRRGREGRRRQARRPRAVACSGCSPTATC